jgi:metallo-beta-lactamase family protein
MRLSFHGADRTVTGSCHLVECAGRRLLIDCGLRQGSRELDEENAAPFGFEPAAVDYVLLTHAHLDHCGRLPLLVARGFRGEIIATAATRELAHIVMLDAAHLQREEARSRTRRAERHGETVKIQPLYTPSDALNALQRFKRAPRYGEILEVSTGVGATFFDAGHILGSASVALEVTEGPNRRIVVFSGDIGNRGRPLLRDPVLPPRADAVVMETTYGDRVHKPIDASVAELYEAVADTLRRGGNVIIPTFALERAQEVLYFLREGAERGVLPQSMPVYLDSPMAISATQIFEHHPEGCTARIAELLRARRDPFHLPGLHFTREHADSVALNEVHGGAVIMAGSGMCTGGRVRHHLRYNLPRQEASVVFVGYAARGTLAREIIDGAAQVRLFGEEIPVRARIYTNKRVSAHADRDELMAWHCSAAPERTFLVHGDEDVMQRFAERLGGSGIEMPSEGQGTDL